MVQNKYIICLIECTQAKRPILFSEGKINRMAGRVTDADRVVKE